MIAIAEYRSTAAGLPDLLEYASLLDEGIVLGKDGSLMAGFSMRGKDAFSASDAERNYLTEMVNNYLLRFDSGWAMWVDSIRTPSPGYTDPSLSHFPDPISAMIDAERREMFEEMGTHFENSYVLILKYLPPIRRREAVIDLIYTDSGTETQGYADRVLAGFKQKLLSFQDGLRDLISLRRMGSISVPLADGGSFESDELVNYLHFCLTGSQMKIRIPACPMYMDFWLGNLGLWTGDVLRVGDKLISCISIEGFPSHSHPGMLSFLEDLPLSFRWSTRFIFLEQHEALAILNSFHKKWTQKVRGIWSTLIKKEDGVINDDAVEKSMETKSAIGHAHSGNVAFGYYTPTIVLMDENREFLDEQARYVKKELEHRGFPARIENINTIEAWLGTLPGHAVQNVRRVPFHTKNLSDLLPLSATWPGLKVNPSPLFPDNSPPLMHVVTGGSTPLRLNLHVGDVAHTLIFGPTGAGKSTLIGMLVSQFLRYASRAGSNGATVGSTVTVFDKGNSIYALCSAIGGIHHDIGSDDSSLSLCPLAEIDSISDSIWAEEWIETCYELQKGQAMTPRQKKLAREAIESLCRKEKKYRTMSEFLSTVQEHEIQDAIAHYCAGGGLGRMLEGQEDSLGNARMTVFEIEELMNLGEKNSIPVLSYLFRRFEKSLKGQPAMLVIDEAWVIFGNKVFRDKLREWLKVLRKKNCGVVLATQSLSDAINSGILDVLVEQCPTKILLPNIEADLTGTKEVPGPADMYAMFGLNYREIEILKTLQYKKHYYYRSPLGRRVFDLGLGPLALSFLSASDMDRLREVKAHEREHGVDWPLRWLENKGVNYEKYIA